MRQYGPTRRSQAATSASRRPPTLATGILFRAGDGDDPETNGTMPAFAIDLRLDELITPIAGGGNAEQRSWGSESAVD